MSRLCAPRRNTPPPTETPLGSYSSSSRLLSIEQVVVAHQKQECQRVLSTELPSNSSAKRRFHVPGIRGPTEPAVRLDVGFCPPEEAGRAEADGAAATTRSAARAPAAMQWRLIARERIPLM